MHLRRREVVAALAVVMAFVPACQGTVEARDQWVVHITTDAPVPQVVDRALVEVVDERGAIACSDCRRQLGVPLLPSAWPISFGIESARPDAKLVVRVRLYRAQRAGTDGLPDPATTIDMLARLPAALGKTDVAVTLTAECLGVAANTEKVVTCVDATRRLVEAPPATPGRPAPGTAPGTWPRALERECAGTPPQDMACMRGGFFVLGGFTLAAADGPSASAGVPQRFVTLSPFFIDRDEVSVKTVRELVATGKLSEPPHVRSPDPSNVDAMCTYLGPGDSANDALPINCISHGAAAASCAALGKRLPTEAEWEYVARDRGARETFAWADDGETCDIVDVGLGRLPAAIPLAAIESFECRTRPHLSSRDAGVQRQPNPRDRTEGGILRMGGAVSEWVADNLKRYSDACWKPESPFLVDPRCEVPLQVGVPELHVLRGAAWSDVPGLVFPTLRQGASGTGAFVGFRCAKGGQ
jgi:sulfatase modifying factor 1